MTLKTKILSVAFFTISFISFAQSNCKGLKGCERKLCELNTKLEYAKQYGNQHKIKGIEDAIYHTQRNCTTSKVYSDFDKKIKEKEEKVKEKTNDLNEAIRNNEKAEKIKKKRKKLEEAKAELKEAILTRKTK